MLIVKNCPDPKLIPFIDLCKSKFEWKYPVTLEFRDKFRYDGAYYDSSRRIVIKKQKSDMMWFTRYTIAHEIRHAQQDMHKLLSEPYGATWERDANDFARKLRVEFENTEGVN